MSGYIGTQPVPQATQKRQAFTATNGQTSFATSGYSVGFVDVYMNGVKLAAADYTATNGSDVVLSSGALVNDIVEIVAFTSFVVSGGLPTTGGTVTGDITFNDSIKSKFGTGADLQVFHNGTDAKINNDTGHLDLSNTTAGSSIRILGSGESLAEFTDDGDVDLFHNGALKFSTTATGVAVTGTVSTTGKVALPATVGTAGQLLQVNAGASAAAWATVSSEAAAVAFPSNWASPTNTYNSSGTWSKGSLADTAYVWFFLLNSGGGGGASAANGLNGGVGGSAMLIYAQAKTFNGAAYVIGAAKAGATSGTGTTPSNPTTLTLSSGNGSTAFTPLNTDASNVLDITSGVTGTYLVGSVAPTYTIYVGAAPSGYANRTLAGAGNSVFAGGMGLKVGNGSYSSTSLLSGNGGVNGTRNGVFPGGGGGSYGSQGGTGAAGQLRVYHV